jgi:hypothetical protein
LAFFATAAIKELSHGPMPVCCSLRRRRDKRHCPIRRDESFDFASGGDDAYIVVDLPDTKTAAAIALAVNSSTAVRASTVVLLTPEEIDAAASSTVSYTPPGG